jgi:hypothetical protein
MASHPNSSPTETRTATEVDVHQSVTITNQDADGEPVYSCQATTLPQFTTPLAWWDVRQYWEDFASGNATVGRIVSGCVYSTLYHLSEAGIGLGRLIRWLYDRVQKLRDATPFPRRRGTIPIDQKTPTGHLDLQPGEIVRIKSYREILATLNTENRNRGLYFDAEMVPFCGGSFRVVQRVTKIVDEKTGVMSRMKHDCIMLEGVNCTACYSDRRMFCPRSIPIYWREIWLERVTQPTNTDRVHAPPTD